LFGRHPILNFEAQHLHSTALPLAGCGPWLLAGVGRERWAHAKEHKGAAAGGDAQALLVFPHGTQTQGPPSHGPPPGTPSEIHSSLLRVADTARVVRTDSKYFPTPLYACTAPHKVALLFVLPASTADRTELLRTTTAALMVIELFTGWQNMPCCPLSPLPGAILGIQFCFHCQSLSFPSSAIPA